MVVQLNRAEALKREVFATVRESVARGAASGDRKAKSVAVGLVPPSKGSREYRVAVRLPAGGGRVNTLIAQLNKHARDFDIVRGVRYRPRLVLRAGGSCGHERGSAGTLGGFVEDDEHYFVLSNSHILANSGDCRVGDPILQPGPADLRPGRFSVIARLTRWTKLRTGKGRADAAIARLSDDATEFYPRWMPGIGEMARVPIADRLSIRCVVKRGRTSGVTRGTISAFDLDGVEIDYSDDEDGSRIVSFDHQLEFVGPRRNAPFSKPGDSGSFILDAETLRPAALLFAGGRDSKGIDRTLGHFMPEVLAEMGARIAQ
jgi:hypothetical protein